MRSMPTQSFAQPTPNAVYNLWINCHPFFATRFSTGCTYQCESILNKAA